MLQAEPDEEREGERDDRPDYRLSFGAGGSEDAGTRIHDHIVTEVGEAVLAGFGRAVVGNSGPLAVDSSRALLDGWDAGPKPLTKSQTAKAIS